jgi:hypothetical protein
MGESTVLKTSIDSFLDLVKEKKQLTLPDAAEALGASVDIIERWALVLDKKGLVKLVYPENPFDKPVVRAVSERRGC